MAVGRKDFLNLICIKVHLKYSLTVNIQLSHHTFVKNHTHDCELSPSFDEEAMFSVLFTERFTLGQSVVSVNNTAVFMLLYHLQFVCMCAPSDGSFPHMLLVNKRFKHDYAD